MTRLAGFSLLWYCIASIVVIVFGFFGSLKHGEVTYIGMLIFLFWGLVFVSQRELKVDIFILKPRSLRLGFYFLVALIDLLAILAILRFGPSPVLGALVGIDPGALLFQGLYREQLPLRALGPPAAVAVGIFAYLGIKKNILRKSDGFIAGFSIIFFVSVYETRHILIWIFIYLISLAIAENGLVKSMLHASKNLKLYIFVAFAFLIFKVFGEIRSGLSEYLEEAGPSFAEAMAIDESYWHIGMSGLWVIIYMFSSFARGMENDSLYALVDFYLPDKLFPGFLQFLTQNMRPASGLLLDRFSGQMFAVDAWHTYAANFGVLGAFLFINVFFVTVFILYKTFSDKLIQDRLVNSAYFFVLTWLFARLYLFSFGDYFLDFGSLVELTFIILVVKVAGIKISKRRNAGIV